MNVCFSIVISVRPSLTSFTGQRSSLGSTLGRILLRNHVYFLPRQLPSPGPVSNNVLDPVSFVIICVSLGLALKPEFRTFAKLVLKKTLSLRWWLKLWSGLWRTRFRVSRRVSPIGTTESIEAGRAGHKYNV
jgi:hypothetical protein